jgi:hypothetical protein
LPSPLIKKIITIISSFHHKISLKKDLYEEVRKLGEESIDGIDDIAESYRSFIKTWLPENPPTLQEIEGTITNLNNFITTLQSPNLNLESFISIFTTKNLDTIQYIPSDILAESFNTLKLDQTTEDELKKVVDNLGKLERFLTNLTNDFLPTGVPFSSLPSSPFLPSFKRITCPGVTCMRW